MSRVGGSSYLMIPVSAVKIVGNKLWEEIYKEDVTTLSDAMALAGTALMALVKNGYKITNIQLCSWCQQPANVEIDADPVYACVVDKIWVFWCSNECGITWLDRHQLETREGK